MLEQLLWAVVGAVLGAVLGWFANGWQNGRVRRREFDDEFRSRRLTLRVLWLDRGKLDHSTFCRQFGSQLDALADLMRRAGDNYALKVSFLNRYFAVGAAFDRFEREEGKAPGELAEELEAMLQMAPADVPRLSSTGLRDFDLHPK